MKKADLANHIVLMCNFLSEYRNAIAHITDLNEAKKFYNVNCNIKKAEYVAKYEELLAIVERVNAGEFQEAQKEEEQKAQLMTQIQERFNDLSNIERFIRKNWQNAWQKACNEGTPYDYEANEGKHERIFIELQPLYKNIEPLTANFAKVKRLSIDELKEGLASLTYVIEILKNEYKEELCKIDAIDEPADNSEPADNNHAPAEPVSNEPAGNSEPVHDSAPVNNEPANNEPAPGIAPALIASHEPAPAPAPNEQRSKVHGTLYDIDSALIMLTGVLSDSEYMTSEELCECYPEAVKLGLISDNGINIELVASYLNKLYESKEIKVKNVAYYIKELANKEDTISEEAKRLQARKNTVKNRREWLERYLLDSINYQSIEVPNSSIKITVRNSKQVKITEASLLPEEYIRTKVEKQPDKVAIKKAISEGIDVPGATIVDNMNIKIS